MERLKKLSAAALLATSAYGYSAYNMIPHLRYIPPGISAENRPTAVPIVPISYQQIALYPRQFNFERTHKQVTFTANIASYASLPDNTLSITQEDPEVSIGDWSIKTKYAVTIDANLSNPTQQKPDQLISTAYSEDVSQWHFLSSSDDPPLERSSLRLALYSGKVQIIGTEICPPFGIDERLGCFFNISSVKSVN